MTFFLLKIIAVICMVCDHIRYLNPIFNVEITKILGRIAIPIFAFFISEGCIHTHNIKKYLQRLLIFAFVSQIPFMLFCLWCNICEFKNLGLNVIFTLFTGALAILAYSKIENRVLKIISIFSLAIIATILNMDYGAYGVLVILEFYIFKDTKFFKYIFSVVILMLQLLIQIQFNFNYLKYCMPFFIGYIISAVLLKFYNQKQGKYKLKYFFYFFYPIHMLILAMFAHWGRFFLGVNIKYLN